jgi:hypothetical protein
MASETSKKDMAKMRKKMDGSEGFMKAHQIKKVRVLFGQKDTPEWASNDAEVRVILLRVFPKLATDWEQRKRAARWNQAIMLVYRMGLPYNHAAAEMGVTVDTVRSLLRNIRRAALNKRSDTNQPRKGKRGRPMPLLPNP